MSLLFVGIYAQSILDFYSYLQIVLARMQETSITKDQIKSKNIVAMIAAIMLVLALFPWPYGYYIFLRWVVGGSAAFLAWVSFGLKKSIFAWVAVLVALLFNPIAPVHLDREIWSLIDLFVAGFFIVSILLVKHHVS